MWLMKFFTLLVFYINSFNKYILNAYYMLSTVSGAGDTSINKTGIDPPPLSLQSIRY